MNESKTAIEKGTALFDVPVLITFFARPEPLKEVFRQVRIAKPSKLFLYQDGPRLNRQEDNRNIEKCRQIVEDIDWDCKVKTYYQEKNYGCDPSMFIAIRWAFSYVDKCIILEDDDVPSQSFFPFCYELLERYKDDERITMICGLNHMNEYNESPYSYVFTKSGAITGLALWKRVIDQWDGNYSFLTDPFAIRLIKDYMGKKPGKKFINICINHKNSGKAHYESILASSSILNNGLNIAPCRNLISNIGVVPNATHGPYSVKFLPKGIRGIFFMKTNELEFPLKHPKYVIEDTNYKAKVDRIIANGFPLVQLYRRIESIIYRSLHRDFSFISKAFRTAIRIIK